MSSSRAIQLSEKESYLLVRLDHDGGTHGFTDWTSDIPSDEAGLDGNPFTYLSTPSMAVTLPDNTGTLEPVFGLLELPREQPITINLTRGLPHGRVTVTIREVFRPMSGGPAAHIQFAFRGILTRSTLNFQGDKDRIQFQMAGPKSFMNIPLGIQANPTCDNALGDADCKVNLALLIEGGTVTAINGSVVTITGLTSTPDFYWRKGTVELDGLELDIRDWSSSDPTKFYLSNEPQPSWIGQVVIATPGCAKNEEECDVKFGNLANFRGLGFAMPAYNPNLETGG